MKEPANVAYAFGGSARFGEPEIFLPGRCRRKQKRRPSGGVSALGSKAEIT
jgi:hypothetical protein